MILFPSKMLMFSLISAASCLGKVVEKQEETTKTEEKVQTLFPLQEKLFNSKTCVLSNGLRVVVVKDHLVPRVSVGVLYNVGSADDPENLVGISHMTEHMFFHGSTRYPKFDDTISELGGYTNACTSSDFTMYIEDIPSSALPLILDMEADRMAHFNLKDDKIFKKEQKAVFEERLRCIENRPLGLVSEYIDRVLSPQHPYGVEIIGMPHHIHAYTREAIMKHYNTWYKPNNATLIVVGDVDEKEVFSEAEKTFGSIQSGKVPERIRVQNTIQDDFFQDITYHSDKVASNKIDLFYKAPSHKTDPLAKCLALQIGLNALFESTVFEFSRYFIDQKAFASDLFYNFNYSSFDKTPLVIGASLMPGISIDRFLKEFKEKIKEIAKKGVKKVDFERAKRSAIISAVYSVRDGHRKIRDSFMLLAQGYTVNEIEDDLKLLSAITFENVNQVLKEVFSELPVATVRLCPKKGAKIQ